MTIQLILGTWWGPLSQHPLPPGRHQPHLLIPSDQTINQRKGKNPQMTFNSQQIVLYSLGLHTQNPGLREIDLQPTAKGGSEKMNILKERRTPEKKLYHTAWTHILISALREVDLEPSAERGAKRIKNLVSLYWSSRSLHLKESPNQIPHK